MAPRLPRTAPCGWQPGLREIRGLSPRRTGASRDRETHSPGVSTWQRKEEPICLRTRSPHRRLQPGGLPLPTASGNSSLAHRGPETAPPAASELLPPSEKQAPLQGCGCLRVHMRWSPATPRAGGRPPRSPGTPLDSIPPHPCSPRLTRALSPVSLWKGPRELATRTLGSPAPPLGGKGRGCLADLGLGS